MRWRPGRERVRRGQRGEGVSDRWQVNRRRGAGVAAQRGTGTGRREGNGGGRRGGSADMRSGKDGAGQQVALKVGVSTLPPPLPPNPRAGPRLEVAG